MDGSAGAIEGLDPVGCRVLGSLIEKERATPQNYPLTLNSLRLACNQSTGRDPVVDYDDHTVETTLGWLREQRLIRIVYSPSNRAAKYRHVLDELLHLGDDELAALGVLLLRGPQTAGEIKGRAERLFAFADLAAVNETLERLMAPRGRRARRPPRAPARAEGRPVPPAPRRRRGGRSTAPFTAARRAHRAARLERAGVGGRVGRAGGRARDPRRRPGPPARRARRPRSRRSWPACAPSSTPCAPSSSDRR